MSKHVSSSTASIPPADGGLDRELRVALVMTGGVSLAVWMGGVTSELYQAVWKRGVYGRLLELTKSTMAIDIVSGSSAGGINGAFLSLALARSAEPAIFDELRSIWLESGSLTALVRSPFDRTPSSLLRGDDYFLRQLREALAKFARADRADDGPSGPIDLVMTASVLTPRRRTFLDDFGTRLTQPDHQAQFRFDRDRLEATGEAAQEAVLDQLARAARTTASFPGAFEASWVEIGDRPGHPNMRDVSDIESSRWAVDGGVLVNQPVGPALDLILDRPAGREIRRVLVYVNPDPSGTADRPIVDDIDDPPELANVVAKSVVSMPRTESIAEDLERIRRNNDRLLDQRQSRESLLLGYRVRDVRALDDGGTQGGDMTVRTIGIVNSARAVYPAWLRRRSIRSTAARVSAAATARGQTRRDPISMAAGETCTWERYERALRYARRTVGWFDSDFPLAEADERRRWAAVADDQGQIDRTPPAVLSEATEWRFGREPIEYMCSVVLDLVRRAYELLPTTGTVTEMNRFTDLRAHLNRHRAALHDERSNIAAVRRITNEFWEDVLAAGVARAPDETDNAYLVRIAEDAYLTWPIARVRPTRCASSWSRLIDLVLQDVDAPEAAALRTTTDDGPDAVVDRFVAVADLLDPPVSTSAKGIPWSAAHLAVRHVEMQTAKRVCAILVAAAETVEAVTNAHEAHYSGHRTAAGHATSATTRPADSRAPWEVSEAFLLRSMIDRLCFHHHGTQKRSRSAAEVIQLLLAMYVLQFLTDDQFEEREARIDFLQLSADGAIGADSVAMRATPSEKLAGLQVAHFGAFVKESWRANDWMWGTLDATRRLLAMILEPRRLRQCFGASAELVASIEAIFADTDALRGHASGGPPATDAQLAADAAELVQRWRAATGPGSPIARELAFLDGPAGTVVPAHLDATVDAVSALVQLLVARRELPRVARAVEKSALEGAALGADARRFCRTMAPYVDSLSPTGRVLAVAEHLPLRSVPGLLAQCNVGRERMVDETGSDQLTATAATLAAVAGSVVSNEKGGLRALRHPAKSLRLALVGFYLLASSALKGTKSAFAGMMLLLAVAGSIVAIALLGAPVPTPVWVLAGVLLSLWIVVSARVGSGRWRTVVSALPIAAAVATIGASAASRAQASDVLLGSSLSGAKVTGRWTMVAVLLALGAGNVAGLAIWYGHGDRARQRWRCFWATACVAGAWATWRFWPHVFLGRDQGFRGRILDALGALHQSRWVVVLVLVPASVLAYEYLRRQLRTVRRLQTWATAEARSAIRSVPTSLERPAGGRAPHRGRGDGPAPPAGTATDRGLPANA